MRHTQHSMRRGMSLVEGMISMGVLVIGILGALQGILFASQQNAVASKLARATSMAAQIRLGIESQGRVKLKAGMLTSSCTAVGSVSATIAGLLDGMAASTVTGACVVDVDAWDNAAATIDKLVGNYNFAQDFKGNAGPFRRLIVYLPTATADDFAVIVSVPDTGRRVFVRQFVGLYDSSVATGNGTGVSL